MATFTPLQQTPQNALLAQLLASQPAPSNVGQGIFSAAQALAAGLQSRGAQKQELGRERKRQALAQQLAQGLDPAMRQRLGPLLQNRETAPMVQQALVAQLLQGAEPVDPVTLSPGQSLIDPTTGQPIASLPDRPRAVGAGGALVGPDGQIILEREPSAPVNVNVGQGDFKVPANFMRDPSDPSRVVPIPGGPAERQSSQEAGRTQLLRSGLKSLNNAVDKIFSGGDIDGGTINRDAIATSNLPVVGSIPGTQGVQIRNDVENAIEAKLRAETGAAATQDEVNRLMSRFMPAISDNDETIRAKAKGLREFLRGSLELTGTDVPAEARSGGGPQPQAPAPQRLGEASAGEAAPEEGGARNFSQMQPAELATVDLSKASPQEIEAFMKRAAELGF